MPPFKKLLEPGQAAFKAAPPSLGYDLPLVFQQAAQAFQAGTADQANRVVNSPLVQQGNAAAAQIKAPVTSALATLGAPILNPSVNKTITNAAMSPVSTFGTPALKSAGVPAGVATGIGVVGDILATPGGKAKGAEEAFKGFTDLSTKLLEKLKGKTTVSKQFISDLTNSADLKQPERDLIRGALADEGKTVDVPTFAEKVKEVLLPLQRTTVNKFGAANDTGRYENIVLPDNLRGPVANYDEHVYQSPVKTSAADVHFGGNDNLPGYFAHTRVEDLPATASTRRVIELQSDLFQKGRLENEYKQAPIDDRTKAGDAWNDLNLTLQSRYGSKEAYDKLRQAATEGISKLEPYKNTWHERVIREEVKQAAVDGKTKLQFPTGETAMKIEGLGSGERWTNPAGTTHITPDTLKVGAEVRQRGHGIGDSWIITDVLGDGKFKAVDKRYFDDTEKLEPSIRDEGRANRAETFDISDTVDKENPIYKFYEKEVGRYLKNKYGAEQITDPQGVKWWQVNVKPEEATKPVLAYGKAPIGAAILGGAAGAGLVGGLKAGAIPSKTSVTSPVQEAPQAAMVRGVPVSKADFDNELRPVIFGEVSNRTPDKQKLEASVILNTALNRMAEDKKRGRDTTLAQVLSHPNQYQAYNGNQYKLYKAGTSTSLDSKKKEQVDSILNDLWTQMRSGTFDDNTQGAAYYKHNPDGSITYDNTRSLYK